jgi:hypothetical protein
MGRVFGFRRIGMPLALGLSVLAIIALLPILGLAGCDTALRDRIELYVNGCKQIQSDGVVYVDGINGTDSNPGTQELPKKTIQNAIDLADALMDLGEVRVAQGTYHLYKTLIVREGISIFGGYSGVPDWTPPPIPGTEPTTTLEGEGIDTVIQPEKGVTSVTLIQGFNIQAADENTVCGIWCDHASPTIRYNYIDASEGDSHSFGIYNKYASSIINGNTINAGGGLTWAWGIWNFHASPKIWNNVIYGEDGSADFRGIYNEADCDTLIQNNTIRVGTTLVYGYGIYDVESTFLVENNIFFSTHSANGCAIYEPASIPLLEELNNNDFYNCASCYGYGNSVTYLDFGEMITYLNDKSIPVSVENTTENPRFDDPTGVDPWDWTLSGNDTNDAVSHGGMILDTFFDNDRTGIDRTPLSNWSMGAYEQDS